ncbi:MAG TPA: RNA-directed DNA polymerase [Lacunisphaera sp.]
MLRPGDLQKSGITRRSLLKSWILLRKSMRQVYRRDVVDFLEYDINPDVWIKRLFEDIRDGHYQPETPARFNIAKSNGFKRQVTRACIPDAVLYRTIVDLIYQPFTRYKVKHAYFARNELSEVQAQIAVEEEDDDDDYRPDKFSHLFLINPFVTWKQFNQYRKLLIFEKVHPFIISTDITNFFDSILHNQIHKTLCDISTPRSVVELLLLLLERLSPKAPLAPTPGIGLPVEEFGCSRSLAHILLFSHDLRMVALVGEENYVRWMDDQNLGVDSYSKALRTVGEIQRSLQLLHLTPNSGKTKILGIEHAFAYYHIETNTELDGLDSSGIVGRDLRRLLLPTWRKARLTEGTGEFAKILKRFYRLFALAGSPLLVGRAHRDAIRYPELAPRIVEYCRCVQPAAAFVTFSIRLLQDENQVYEDTAVAVFETFLKLEPGAAEARAILRLAELVFSGESTIMGAGECAPIAPLLFLRYGDGRTLRRLTTALSRMPRRMSEPSLRAVAVVLAGSSRAGFATVKECAARSHRNVLATVVRMVDEILNYQNVPSGFKDRVRLNFDSLEKRHRLDMRALATLKLLQLNPAKNVQAWLQAILRGYANRHLSEFERVMLGRHFPLLMPDPLPH